MTWRHGRCAPAPIMSDLRLSVALGDYYHVRHLVDGRVRTPGLDLVWVQIQNEEILQRSFRHREWDVSEFSLAQYVALRSRGSTELIAIPVFPSRVFRHGSIFVRQGGISAPEQLAGARIGVPEWVQTAGVWTRGLLADEYDLDLASVRWVQGGLHTPGREEHIVVALPAGIEVQAERRSALQDLLVAGEIDAIISARPPDQAKPGGPIVPLFDNHRELELDWGRRTKIVPIMHIVVVRSELYARSPWLVRGLLDAFSEAKQLAVSALADLTTSQVPVPWVGEEFERLRDLFDGEWWPYGVEANRHQLETFLRYARSQGIASPELSVNELFPPETMSEVRV